MTPQQQQFVDAYLESQNATKAAEAAGYSKKTAKAQGSRLLTRVDIKQAIERRLSKVSAQADVTAEWILERLRVEAMNDGEGSTQAGRVKALELLGKRLRLFVDKVETVNTATLRITEVIVDADGNSQEDRNDGPAAPVPSVP
jgi:phage terminase small subunit